jgi:hypothetical protein
MLGHPPKHEFPPMAAVFATEAKGNVRAHILTRLSHELLVHFAELLASPWVVLVLHEMLYDGWEGAQMLLCRATVWVHENEAVANDVNWPHEDPRKMLRAPPSVSILEHLADAQLGHLRVLLICLG